MAYCTKETVQKVRTELKKLNKLYGMKTSVAGSNTNTLKITIQSGQIDLIGNYLTNATTNTHIVDRVIVKKYVSVNRYWLTNQFDGVALEYITKVIDIAKLDHFDESDSMIDYFHCSYYIDVSVGRYNKGYELI